MVTTRNRLPARPRKPANPTQRFLVAVHEAMEALHDMTQEPGRPHGLCECNTCNEEAGIRFNLEVARSIVYSQASPHDSDAVDAILAAR
ncbi:MAG: hypothetical protein JNM56_32870 [Planctomycetia bacterium]|nr:hypothetical protein [Planctomycetia bacterium]